MHQKPLSRRVFLAAGASALLTAEAAAGALAAADFGVTADGAGDQTAVLQRALDAAAGDGKPVLLPAGRIRVAGLSIPGQVVIEGIPGRTVLTSAGGVVARIAGASDITLRGVGFAAEGDADPETGLLAIEGAEGILLDQCRFTSGPQVGVTLFDAAATIRDCTFAELGDAAIHALDSRGLILTGNRISGCGNAGIRIWRGENGRDGSIISGNRISGIDWRDGGNGQNGNGINIFRADEVIVADNHIADCAFTAIRLNSTNNTQVTGNLCLNSGEVAIFSEFDFSGSIVANNLVDGAATGIAITNLDTDGHLAVCSGNIVRNIAPASLVNPDTIPIGIYVEAETAVTGNTVANVPGAGIVAGNGPYLRNVLISANVISASRIGIGVSVVEGAGQVHIADNIVHDARDHAMVGLAWTEIVEPDLAANAGRYPNVRLGSP